MDMLVMVLRLLRLTSLGWGHASDITEIETYCLNNSLLPSSKLRTTRNYSRDSTDVSHMCRIFMVSGHQVERGPYYFLDGTFSIQNNFADNFAFWLQKILIKGLLTILSLLNASFNSNVMECALQVSFILLGVVLSKFFRVRTCQRKW